MKSSRNGLIEWVRFFAAIVIAAYHFEWIYLSHTVYLMHGYIFVEFFFCLSGYFLAKNQCDPNTAKDAFLYVKNQVAKMYPLYITAFLFCFVENCIWNGWNTVYAVIDNLWNAKWEILLLVEQGFAGAAFTHNQGGASDYISAMLMASFVLCWIIHYHKKMFIDFAALLFSIVGYAYILTNAGTISQWRSFNGLVCMGVVRAIAGMSAGALGFLIFRNALQAKHWKQKYLLLPISFVFIGWMVYGKNVSLVDVVLCVPVFSLILALLDVFSLSSAAKNRFFEWMNRCGCRLGQISFSIFLFHWPVLCIVKKYLPERTPWKVMLLYMVCVIFIAQLATVCRNMQIKKPEKVEK